MQRVWIMAMAVAALPVLANAYAFNDSSMLERSLAKYASPELQSASAKATFCEMQRHAIEDTKPLSPERRAALRAMNARFPGSIGRATNCMPYQDGDPARITSAGEVVAVRSGDILTQNEQEPAKEDIVGHYSPGKRFCVLSNTGMLYRNERTEVNLLEIGINSRIAYLRGAPGNFRPAPDPGDCPQIADYTIERPSPKNILRWSLIYGVIGGTVLLFAYGFYIMIRNRRS